MRSSADIYALEKQSVWRMVLHVAAPIIISLSIQAVYTLVDGIYVSRIDESAISAVSLAFIIQHLQTSLFTGLATGINAVTSKALGSGDRKKARNATLNGVVLVLAVSVFFVLFGLLGVDKYFRGSTKDLIVIEYGISYLRPCMYASSITALQIVLERFLQSSGLTQYSMISHFIGCVTNIVLDPILKRSSFCNDNRPICGYGYSLYSKQKEKYCSF